MAGTEALHVPLPDDILDAQISMLDLIIDMFPGPGEVEIPSETSKVMARLRDPSLSSNMDILPPNVNFTLSLSLGTQDRIIQLKVCVPLQSSAPEISEPPSFTYAIRQPSWMSRGEVADLSNLMPKSDIFGALDYLQDPTSPFRNPRAAPDNEDTNSSNALVPKQSLVRVFFYFPSLSTREKRMDLVRYATDYQLTGFVLAGKPGVLCVEGVSVNIDTYMNYIKMNSWGDIPSHQKKVSERYREGGVNDPIERCFDDMTEITDSLGEKKGKRVNRGDMKALETWMMEKGLGNAFERVIMQTR